MRGRRKSMMVAVLFVLPVLFSVIMYQGRHTAGLPAGVVLWIHMRTPIAGPLRLPAVCGLEGHPGYASARRGGRGELEWSLRFEALTPAQLGCIRGALAEAPAATRQAHLSGLTFEIGQMPRRIPSACEAVEPNSLAVGCVQGFGAWHFSLSRVQDTVALPERPWALRLERLDGRPFGPTDRDALWLIEHGFVCGFNRCDARFTALPEVLRLASQMVTAASNL